MKHRPTLRGRRSTTKSILRLLDHEHAKTTVLNSLTSPDAQQGCRHAIDEFVEWYCSDRAWCSTESSFCATALISNRADSRTVSLGVPTIHSHS